MSAQPKKLLSSIRCSDSLMRYAGLWSMAKHLQMPQFSKRWTMGMVD